MPSKALAGDRATPQAGWGLKAGAWFAVLFLNLPILFIVLYGFTTDEQSYSFPPRCPAPRAGRSPCGRSGLAWRRDRWRPR